MVNIKVVIGLKEGKSVQKELSETETPFLYQKSIGETVLGEGIGFPGYEFLITGGSDKCGFPMRKGIQTPRKKIYVGHKSVGYSGKDRSHTKQKGLVTRKIVCGEMINENIHQVNLKVMKAGAEPLGGSAEEAVETKEE